MTNILDSIGITTDGVKVAKRADSRAQWNKFIDDMLHNNTYCPEITRIIYNVGTKAYPILDDNGKRVKDENGKVKFGEPVKVLTTVVFFDDKTKVTVTNSENDGVKFTQVHAVPEDENSPIVEVADVSSKEAGLVYAIVKRLIGYADKNGTINGDGYGRKLREYVSYAYDTIQTDAANKYKNKLSKEAYKAKLNTGKPKRPSFADTVIDFRAAVDGLQQTVATLKADIDAAKKSL